MFDLTRKNNNHLVNSYNPFREMEEMENKLFNNFFGNNDLAEFKSALLIILCKLGKRCKIQNCYMGG